MFAPAQRQRWGDTLDEDEALPPRTIRGPDEHGVKVVTDYFRNDKGDAVKRVTKLKVLTVAKKVYSISDERKKWVKFGAAAKETPQDSVTVQTVEDIPFERVRQAKATSSEKKAATDVQSLLSGSADKIAISGSLKDILYRKRMERELLRAKGLLKGAEKAPDEDGAPDGKPALVLGGAPKAGSYVPPSLRGGGRGPATMGPGPGREGGGGGGGGDGGERRRDENSVRVTNLSDDVTEDDLGDLFRPFGHVPRIYLAVDRTTGESRGFAFVTFTHREDGEKAIRTLNGYGYGHLILKVEWAAPREERK